MKALADYHLNPKNPRTIRDKEFKALVRSLRDFAKEMLPKRPIVVDEDGMVLAGSQRFEGLKELQFVEVPDDWISTAVGWTAKQKEEFIIKDNLHSGTWDTNLLTAGWDMSSLQAWGLEIPGFTDAPAPGKIHSTLQEDDYDIPENIITDITEGDLFTIGQHRLICGDSTRPEIIDRLMAGKKARMTFTDPPYNCDLENVKTTVKNTKQRGIVNDNMSKGDFRLFCHAFAVNIQRWCDGIIYCWAGGGQDGRVMFTVLDETFHNSTTIVWNKDRFTLGRGKYQNKHELCWFGWNVDGKTFTRKRNLSNVWDIDRPKRSDLHPTMKPVALPEKAMLDSTTDGDIILDLFIGSGTTMVAAHQLDRICFGSELTPRYTHVTIDRMLLLDPKLKVTRNGKPYKLPDQKPKRAQPKKAPAKKRAAKSQTP